MKEKLCVSKALQKKIKSFHITVTIGSQALSGRLSGLKLAPLAPQPIWFRSGISEGEKKPRAEERNETGGGTSEQLNIPIQVYTLDLPPQ